ncbi:MAG: hypothetical protein Q9182_004077 [Xanthomendoza sp. 2 TL-2023]
MLSCVRDSSGSSELWIFNIFLAPRANYPAIPGRASYDTNGSPLCRVHSANAEAIVKGYAAATANAVVNYTAGPGGTGHKLGCWGHSEPIYNRVPSICLQTMKVKENTTYDSMRVLAYAREMLSLGIHPCGSEAFVTNTTYDDGFISFHYQSETCCTSWGLTGRYVQCSTACTT